MISFSGQAAVITGANGEIGRAVAQAFASAGARLLLTDLDAGPLADFAATLPGQAHALAHDVTDPAACARVADRAAHLFGAVDMVVNSAGLYQDLKLTGISAQTWRHALAVNLDGVFLTIQALLPHLADGGAVVNIASVAGHRGSVDHTPYAAAKGGVLTLTRSLAQELAPRVRVNAVSPGLIDTRMMAALDETRRTRMIETTPMKRLGTSAEVAGVVAFLCSDLARYVTGETVHVNGGLYIAS